MKSNYRVLVVLVIAVVIGVSLIMLSLLHNPAVQNDPSSAAKHISRLPVNSLPERQARKTIFFGASISKSGRYKTEGQRVIDGYEFWKEWVNNHGGIKVARKSYMVDILYYDDKSRKENVGENIRKLIEKDRVDFLLGPFSSALTLEASKVSEKFGRIMVEPCGAAETIFTRNPRATFGVMTSASWYLKGFVEMISQKKPLPATYAVLTPDKLFPRSVAKGARIWFSQKKIREVYFEKTPVGTVNFTKYLEEMAALSPGIIVLAGHYRDAVNFTGQMANTKGLTPKAVVMTLGPTQRDYVKELGRAAEGMTGITQWVANSSFYCPVFGDTGRYVAEFEKRYGYKPTYQNAQSSAAGVVYQLALEKSRYLDANIVLQNIRSLDQEIFYGRIKFDFRGLDTGHRMSIVQIQDGRSVTVWPAEAAQADYRYPLKNGK